jgi:hypothetical protein
MGQSDASEIAWTLSYGVMQVAGITNIIVGAVIAALAAAVTVAVVL